MGACAQVGADRMLAISRSLEAHAPDLEMATLLAERLERESDRVQQALSLVRDEDERGVFQAEETV